MKILKQGGKYLKNKAKVNRDLSTVLIWIGFGGLLYSFLSSNFSFVYFFILSLILGSSFFGTCSNYARGLAGERKVIQSLSNLSDDYLLVNDIKLKDSYGNIDHVLLGPNGIFVIERLCRNPF